MLKTASVSVFLVIISFYLYVKSHHFEPLPNGFMAKTSFSEDAAVNTMIYEQCLSYFKNGFSVPKGGVVIDIGANRGFFSMLASRNASKVFAFEPISSTNAFCRENLDINNIKNVFLKKSAVSNSNNPLKFTQHYASFVSSAFGWSPKEKNDMKNTLLYYFDHPEETPSIFNYVGHYLPLPLRQYFADAIIIGWYWKVSEEVCECTTVSDLIKLQQLEKIDLLKIDAEKAEVLILQGIVDSDWKKLDKIFIEAHSTELKNECLKILDQRGFKYKVESEDNIGSLDFWNVYAEHK
eukprot:gene3757-6645_t